MNLTEEEKQQALRKLQGEIQSAIDHVPRGVTDQELEIAIHETLTAYGLEG